MYLISLAIIMTAVLKPKLRYGNMQQVQGLPFPLTHLILVLHMCNSELDQHWSIVNWILANKLLWNSNPNSKIFIEENAFENVFCHLDGIQ